jgi:hypothetical protein
MGFATAQPILRVRPPIDANNIPDILHIARQQLRQTFGDGAHDPGKADDYCLWNTGSPDQVGR